MTSALITILCFSLTIHHSDCWFPFEWEPPRTNDQEPTTTTTTTTTTTIDLTRFWFPFDWDTPGPKSPATTTATTTTTDLADCDHVLPKATGFYLQCSKFGNWRTSSGSYEPNEYYTIKSIPFILFTKLEESDTCKYYLRLFACMNDFPPCDRAMIPCGTLCIRIRHCLRIRFNFKYIDVERFLTCDPLNNNEPCLKDSYIPGGMETFIPHIDPFQCPFHAYTPEEFGHQLASNGTIYDNCGTPFNDLLFNEQDRILIRIWILIWSIICLLSSLFALITNPNDPKRNNYPEKTFLSLCYTGISLVFIVGFVSGDSIASTQFTGYEIGLFKDPKTMNIITQGASKLYCSLSFIFLYFFIHSVYIWFTTMVFIWSTNRFYPLWSKGIYEKVSGRLHIFAWTVPFLEALRVLTSHRIEGDPFTGICNHAFWSVQNTLSFTNFGLYIFYSCASICLLIVGSFFDLYSRRGFQDTKLETETIGPVLHVCEFAVIFLCCSFISIIGKVYEAANKDSWIVDKVCLSSGNTNESFCHFIPSDLVLKKPSIVYFLLKYVAQLLPGIVLPFTVYSQKTIESCQSFFGGKKVYQVEQSQPIDI